MLLTIDLIFREHELESLKVDNFKGQIVGEHTKSMFMEFLDRLDYLRGQRTTDLPGYTMLPFFSVLCLFLIRATLRSIQSYSHHGFELFDWSANMDGSFDKGPSCILYQPMLLHLEYFEENFDNWEPFLGIGSTWSLDRKLWDAMVHHPVSESTLVAPTPWSFVQHLLRQSILN